MEEKHAQLRSKHVISHLSTHLESKSRNLISSAVNFLKLQIIVCLDVRFDLFLPWKQTNYWFESDMPKDLNWFPILS